MDVSVRADTGSYLFKLKKGHMGRTSDSKERMLHAGRDLFWKQSYGSVTIDAICLEAGVLKGSFYHFFDSKSELTQASFDELWQHVKPQLDLIFSRNVPPLERLQNYFVFVQKRQVELKKKYGRVVGCLFGSVGSELSHQDDAICAKSREVLACHRKYFEIALRDAQTEGSIKVRNVSLMAQRLSSYVEGCLFQARVQNDFSLLRDLEAGAMELIGAGLVLA
jgi:TetR/AcrR family transcriptional repressor of nem operon